MIRVKKVLLILILSQATACLGQDSTNIYLKSLELYNLYMDQNDPTKKTIYIEASDGITHNFPSHIGTRSIVILTWENKIEVYKRNNNRISHVRILPAKVKNEMIEITFIPYRGTYKGRKYYLFGHRRFYLALSDWVLFQFKFDCNENEFSYHKTSSSGI
jgi:hypothetical protein